MSGNRMVACTPSMIDFASLYNKLDLAETTAAKVDALLCYLDVAPPSDAACAINLFTGNFPIRAASPRDLRVWAAQATQLPAWLIERSYAASGDLSETVALIAQSFARLPEAENQSTGYALRPDTDAPLAWWIDTFFPYLQTLAAPERQTAVAAAWSALSADERTVLNKLLTGSLRFRNGRALIERALAVLTSRPRAAISQRLDSALPLTADELQRLIEPEQDASVHERADCAGLPLPFPLVHALNIDKAQELDPRHWQAQYKFDGCIEIQLVRFRGCAAVWSSEHDNYTERLPELARIGEAFSDGTIIQGWLTAWSVDQDRPGDTSAVRRRLESGVPQPSGDDEPISFLADDLLWLDGQDLTHASLSDRRTKLAALFDENSSAGFWRLTQPLRYSSIVDLERLIEACRDAQASGVILKPSGGIVNSSEEYASWQLLRAPAYSIDAVLLYAEAARGQASSRFHNYSFGVWGAPGGERALIPVAKTSEGLSDADRRCIDRYVLKNTVERHGPVRVIRPSLLCSIEFDGVASSPRHKSGLILRNARAARLLPEATPDQAGTLVEVTSLMERRNPARQDG